MDLYHILAFDIIYCAVVYKFYRGIDIFRPTKANQKERAVKQQIEAAEAEIRELSDQLDGLLVERSAYDGFSAVGLKVRHKKFGEGIITSQQSEYITASFDVGEKRFLLPSSFTDGFLKTDDNEITELLSAMSELDGKIKKIKTEIREKQRVLDHIK